MAKKWCAACSEGLLSVIHVEPVFNDRLRVMGVTVIRHCPACDAQFEKYYTIAAYAELLAISGLKDPIGLVS